MFNKNYFSRIEASDYHTYDFEFESEKRKWPAEMAVTRNGGGTPYSSQRTFIYE